MAEPLVVTPVTFMAGIEGYTQKELAERTGVSAYSLSRAAQSISRLNPKSEHRLARAMQYPDGFFKRNIKIIPLDDLTFRATSRTRRRVIQSVGDEWSALSAVTSILWDRIGREPPNWVDAIAPTSPEGSMLDSDTIERIAARTRKALGLQEIGPVDNLTRTIEESGIVLAPQRSLRNRNTDTRLNSDGVTCPSLPESGFAPAIGFAGNASGDRDRFTKAHELGHIVLQRFRQPRLKQEKETEAHMFASAFLMPAADARLLIDEQTMLSDFLRLKPYWKMSVASLITRGRTAGCYGDDRARSLYMQLSIRKWRQREPIDIPKETTSLLAEMIRRTFGQAENGKVRQSDVEEGTLLPCRFLDEWTAGEIQWAEPTERELYSLQN